MTAAILIAGPTASGKSALALAFAERTGGTVVNADALQVYACWRILSARPAAEDLARAPHALYGHVPCDVAYSVGDWLREVARIDARPPLVFVGGTGLYLTSLTQGLAPVPAIPAAIRAEGDQRRLAGGAAAFHDEIARGDPALWARIDRANAARLQRAWEVLRATGRPLSDWQRQRTAPLVDPAASLRLRLAADPDWLRARIDRRFDAMMAAGALDEVRANRASWDPRRPAARALGAAELMAALDGRMPLAEAVAAAKTATRQYAKRQRTWLRNRMRDWTEVRAERIPEEIEGLLALA